METQQNRKKNLSLAKREADAILATNANRLLLIEALLICGVFVALYLSMTASFSSLLSILSQESESLAMLLTLGYLLALGTLMLFLACPVLLGLFHLAERMQAGDAPTLGDLFYFLTSPARYRRALTLSLAAFWKIALFVAVSGFTTELFYNLPKPTFLTSLCCWVLVSAELLATVALLLHRYAVCFYALRFEDVPVSQARRMARNDAHTLGARAPHFVLSFLPWILLGVVSIGLLLVLDVIPRMLITYFCDCDRNAPTR